MTSRGQCWECNAFRDDHERDDRAFGFCFVHGLMPSDASCKCFIAREGGDPVGNQKGRGQEATEVLGDVLHSEEI